MLKEFSYGAVVYKMQDNEPLFLLAHSKRSGRWGFPKGHNEAGESPVETARREIFEETGIKKLKFIEGFSREDVYIIDGALPQTKGKTVEKHSLYFLARALEEPENFDVSEITELRWVNAQTAQTLLSFDSQKETIEEALKTIEELVSRE